MAYTVKIIKPVLFGAVGIALLAFAGSANALVILSQVGIVAPDNVSGAGPGTLTGGFINSDKAWTHTYSVIGTITGATLKIDLLDADGGRLDLYAGVSTSGTLFGAATGTNQGGPGAWRDLDPAGLGASIDNTINIPIGLFTDLADGTFNVFGDNVGMTLWGSNRALLTITTDAPDGPRGVPEPATLTLLGMGLLGLGWARRRRKAA